MEDRSFLTNNHPNGGVSDTFREFIEALVVEVVINGESFETQKKWLRKNSEAEGVSYETMESNLSDLFEAIKELEEHESKTAEKFARNLAKSYYFSEIEVDKLIDYASAIRVQKEAKRKAQEVKELQKAEALFQQWSACKTPKDFETHIEDLIESAILGFPKAQNELSLCYSIGHFGVQRNIEKAFKWAMASALQNDKVGQFSVGKAYLYGKGVEPNDELAFSWLSKSAQAGVPGGFFYLGICYKYGIGTARNITNAEKLITQAKEINPDHFSKLEKSVTYESIKDARKKATEE
jgi:TPR repeat protein